jgi:hypothetical protein
MFRKLSATAILSCSLVMAGCSKESFDPKISTEDQVFIFTHISDHPSMAEYVNCEVGSGYDEGDSWRIQIRKQGRKSPSLWFRVEKGTGKATLLE